MNIRKYIDNDKLSILNIYTQSKLDELKFEKVKFELLPLEKDTRRYIELFESDIYVYEFNGVVAYGAHFRNEVRALFVQPDVRGKGIGLELLEFILSKINGKASLFVAASNIPAINLYNKYGFNTVETFETTYNNVNVVAIKMMQ